MQILRFYHGIKLKNVKFVINTHSAVVICTVRPTAQHFCHNWASNYLQLMHDVVSFLSLMSHACTGASSFIITFWLFMI